MSDDLKKPLYDDVRKIEYAAQAETWLGKLIEECIQARALCDVTFPNDHNKSVRHQRAAERQYLIKYGAALGTLRALHGTGHIGDIGYETFRQRIMATVVPTVVGVHRG